MVLGSQAARQPGGQAARRPGSRKLAGAPQGDQGLPRSTLLASVRVGAATPNHTPLSCEAVPCQNRPGSDFLGGVFREGTSPLERDILTRWALSKSFRGLALL